MFRAEHCVQKHHEPRVGRQRKHPNCGSGVAGRLISADYFFLVGLMALVMFVTGGRVWITTSNA